MTDKNSINTDGGSVTHGDVKAEGDFVGRDVYNNRWATISGNTVVAIVALLIVAFIAAVAILRPNLSWIQERMPGARPTTAVLSTGSANGSGALVEKPVLDWVEVPAGEFIFGLSNAGLESTLAECNSIQGQCEAGWFDQEQPQKKLSQDKFQISKYEISNAQYRPCIESGECEPIKHDLEGDLPLKDLYFEDNAPVVAVTYYQANAFCHWIGGSLPSEEQWEKAARGKDGRRYPWGNEFDPEKANIAPEYPVNLADARPSPIDSYPNGASPYGVLNMSGNVFEWTTSQRESQYLVRGGSWSKPFYRGRVTDRGTSLEPNFASYDIGFRCIR